MSLWYPFPARDWGFAYHLDNNFEWNSHDLRIVEHRDGKTFFGQMEFVEHEPGELMPPTLRVMGGSSDKGLQSLFNCLWDAGYRPPAGVDPEPVVQAKNENLSDLRRILDKVMEIPNGPVH